SGFVEPLESTGIFFIQHGIEELVENFPRDKVFDENLIASFNAATAECIDGVREFLTIHYVASTRNDTPFWRATKEVAVPEALRERLRIWKSRLPNPRSIYRGYHGFESYSWAVMLLGLGYEPTSSLPMLDHLDIARGEAMFEGVKRRANQLLETLPSQFEYLTRQRGLELPGSSATRVRRSTPTASGMRR